MAAVAAVEPAPVVPPVVPTPTATTEAKSPTTTPAPDPIPTGPYSGLLHLITSYASVNGWTVGSSQRFEQPHGTTIGGLKKFIQKTYRIPTELQHIYHRQLSSYEAKQENELGDGIDFTALKVGALKSGASFSLVVKFISSDSLQLRLPHTKFGACQQLILKLQKIPIPLLDFGSIKEIQRVPDHPLAGLVIRDDSNDIVDHIVIDGELLFPFQIVHSDLIEFRGEYAHGYSAASDAYALLVEKGNAEYETGLAHCKQLLVDLPIALKRSLDRSDELLNLLHRDLDECKKDECKESPIESGELVVDEKELGNLVMEQFRIQKEIETQKAKLPTFRRPVLAKEKFTFHTFQSSIQLAFGCHQLNGQTYHLYPVHPPQQVNQIEVTEA